MKLSKSEYNKIKNDPRISLWIDDWLIPLINMSGTDRLIINQAAIKRDQEYLSESIKNVKKLRSILINDPGLSRLLGIDPTNSRFEGILTHFLKQNDHFKGKRSSQKKEIFFVLKIIFNYLADMGLGQTKQVDFIYTLYKENNFENYATAKNKDVKKALRDRI